jgi:hypothetical protein
MIWTVIWLPPARAQLVDLWIQAPDRQAVNDAVDVIDAELRIDGDTKGIPLGRFLVFTHEPLSVLYEVLPDDCMVRVVAVKWVQ